MREQAAGVEDDDLGVCFEPATKLITHHGDLSADELHSILTLSLQPLAEKNWLKEAIIQPSDLLETCLHHQ